VNDKLCYDLKWGKITFKPHKMSCYVVPIEERHRECK
jgi:hypothetical protein